MSSWTCLEPGCDERGELDEIRTNGGADVRHMKATGHAVTASLSGWCGQRGRPNHAGCRVPCSCRCHRSLKAEPVDVTTQTGDSAGTIGHKDTTKASAPEQRRWNAARGPRRTVKDTTDV